MGRGPEATGRIDAGDAHRALERISFRTSDAAVRAALALCHHLGKTPVVCTDRAGFIVNRLLFPYLNDAVRMLDEGTRRLRTSTWLTASSSA